MKIQGTSMRTDSSREVASETNNSTGRDEVLLRAEAAGLLCYVDGRHQWTAAGEALLRRMAAAQRDEHIPWYERETHTLSWRGREVREFGRRRTAQEKLVRAFAQRQWPGLIRNPFRKGRSREEAREVLHDTVKNLNCTLTPGTIRFRRAGQDGVRWERVGG